MSPNDLRTLRDREREYWRASTTEGGHVETVESLVHKMSEARIFLDCVHAYAPVFESANSILELGGGEGWASCILRRILPAPRRIVASDISADAVRGIAKWQRVFRVNVDERFPCTSYEIPLKDRSVDLVFTFQAAHHFVAHRRTLNEISRVLIPGGVCLYLHEPTCSRLFYAAYRARAIRTRQQGPEDVLVFKKLLQIAEECGFDTAWQFDLTLVNRTPKATAYYSALAKIPLAKHILPGTKHFLFRKKSSSEVARA